MGQKRPPPNATEKSSGFIRMRDTSGAKKSANSYTRIVKVLRWALPTMVAIVFAALMIWPAIHSHKLEGVAPNILPNLVVENLRVTGVSVKDEPYVLMARKALQVPEAKGLFDLEYPEGDITLNGGAWLVGKAINGRYDQNNKKLWLGGGVQFIHDGGYQFSTDEANFDLEHNSTWGEQPVVIQGKFGEITGEGFRILDGGKVMVITGRSKAVLNLGGLTSSGGENGGKK